MKQLIDLDQYPLHELDSVAGQDLVARCVSDLESKGMFTLTGFMRREVIDGMLPELLEKFNQESFSHSRWHNIYFDDEIDSVAADHPALARVETINHTLCGDQLAEPLRQVYFWSGLTDFLARVMQIPNLYPMDDPYD